MGRKKQKQKKPINNRMRRLWNLRSLRQQRDDAVAEVSASDSSAMEVEPNEDCSNAPVSDSDSDEPLAAVRARLRNAVDQFDSVGEYAIAEPSTVFFSTDPIQFSFRDSWLIEYLESPCDKE